MDRRSRTGTGAVVILGDFNRRIDRFGRDDHLRGEIDDGDPSGLDLWRLPFNRESDCNPGFPQPIGFLAVDDRAWQWVDEDSYQESPTIRTTGTPPRGTLSGHCPLAVDLSRR
jgi:hypothetical protein